MGGKVPHQLQKPGKKILVILHGPVAGLRTK